MGFFSKKKNNNQGILSELALNYIKEGVMIVDGNGNIKLINPAAAEMTGIDQEEALGLNYLSVIRFADKESKVIEEEDNPINQVLKNNKPYETRDLEIVTAKSNRKIPVSLIIMPTDGAGSSKIITFRNIEKELKEESEQEEFISTASHEMRTPVASIEGYLGLALNPQTAALDARARQYLTQAHESSQHLGRLFQDLLDVTKLDDKKLKAHMVPINMVELVRNTVQSQVPSILKKGLKFTFNGNRAGITGEKKINQVLYAEVDIDFMKEVLDNIVENAIKYTAKGTISVEVKGDNDNVVVSVTDTGMGIAAEDSNHIFQKFYRVDNTDTRTIGGTGLGLYIAKQRTEAMGGKIWVKSELGKGTTFYVSIPRLSIDEYEKRKIAEANQWGNKELFVPAPGVYASPIVPPVSPVQMPPQTDPALYPPNAAPINPGGGEVAGNLNPEQLSMLKEKFANRLRAEKFKESIEKK
jgi:PAS domain S-box-containing protein